VGNDLELGFGRFATSSAHLLLLIAGLRVGTRSGWLFCLAAIATISLLAWIASSRRSRVVADTPTSRVRPRRSA
jgi:TctA family transporter